MLSSTDGLHRRLLRGGIANILASVVTALVPLLGAYLLPVDEYPLWALIGTLSTFMLVFDFGSQSLATQLAASSAIDRRRLVNVMGLAIAAPLVVGVFAMLIWPIYADAASVPRVGIKREEVSLGLVVGGTLLRSVAAVGLSMLLGQQRFGRRTLTMVGSAAVQFAVTLGALHASMGAVSLGLGLIASGAIQCAAVSGVLAAAARHSIGGEQEAVSIRAFARDKTVVTVIGLLATQCDRWVLALVVGPVFLRTYDVATRLAMLPKVALIALGVGLVTESARAGSDDAAAKMARRASRINVALSCSGGFVALGIALVSTRSFGLPVWAWALCCLAPCVGHAFHGFTIAINFVLTGRRRQDIEARYMIGLGIAVAASYLAGVVFGSGVVTVVGWTLSVAVASALHVVAGPRAAGWSDQ